MTKRNRATTHRPSEKPAAPKQRRATAALGAATAEIPAEAASGAALIEQLRERHRFDIAALASQVYVDLLTGAASEHVRADLAKDALAQVGLRARIEPTRPAPGTDATAAPQPPIQVQVVVPPEAAETLAAQSPVAVVTGGAAPSSE